MKEAPVRVIDAVMGTGKSRWISLSIREQNLRSVVVLPRLSELERYEELLKGMDGLVSLREDHEESSKRERFSEALADAQVVLITHALFEAHLRSEEFGVIEQGEWSLIMDEVITSFEPMDIVTGTDIAGLIRREVIMENPLNDKVTLLSVNPVALEWYLKLPANEASVKQKEAVRTALTKDLLMVKGEDVVTSFFTFALRKERLQAFKEVTILTYPFKDTDLDYWFQINGFEVDHLKLLRRSSTNSLSDFDLKKHDGVYSGKEYSHLIELVSANGRGRVLTYGDRRNHFSATECKKFKRSDDKIAQIRTTLRSLFRNKRKPENYVEAEDFMFTCLKQCTSLWSDKSLPKSFIGDDTWVPFNERGVNGYANRHNLAFLYNVFPQTDVERTVQAFGCEYNAERYALYTLIQWVWRSAIRNGEKIRLYLPSRRMRNILEDWLK